MKNNRRATIPLQSSLLKLPYGPKVDHQKPRKPSQKTHGDTATKSRGSVEPLQCEQVGVTYKFQERTVELALIGGGSPEMRIRKEREIALTELEESAYRLEYPVEGECSQTAKPRPPCGERREFIERNNRATRDFTRYTSKLFR